MISILLATYNGEKYIQKSIDSILNQTFKDWELLIGFNGTIDNSKNIVINYEDSRIRVFDYGDDKGKAKTLNKLLRESKNDWVAIQDDDDIWLPKKLERQIKLINSYDVIGTQIIYINENDEVIGSPSLAKENEVIKAKSLAGDNQVANTSAIFKKACAEDVGGWSEVLDGIEDFDFWLKIMRKDYTFANLYSTEVMHRLHSKSNFNTKKFDLTQIL
ncbi:MAG: glycosyl transferase family 2 [Bacteroidia bacterium]|nr:MAG: glycosyl transferase family 2 [Bacteroidia bacterium]